MKNSFQPTYAKTTLNDGSTTLSFEQSRFFPQAVGTAFVLTSMLIFLPVSCTSGFLMVGKRSNDIPVVQVALMMSIFIALFWFFFIKTRSSTIIVQPNLGIEFDGNSLPFNDIQALGITTKSNSKKTWGYVFAESGGREIPLTKWMDEAQARAIKNDIKAVSGRQFD